MAAHAKLSPSSCARWSTCTASVALIDRLKSDGVVPERSSSIYAAEGTAAHEVRELSLQLGLDPHDFIGMKIVADGYEFTVSEEMAEYLVPGIDWIRERTDDVDVEIRVDLSPWLPGQFGTMDGGFLMVTVDASALVASDLKYGSGEPVSPEKNKQQMLYALGYWHFKDRPKVDKVIVVIDQPRAGGMKFWECSLDELLAFGEEMKVVYAKITSGDTEFVPSDYACRWCEARDPNPAKGYLGCPAYNEWQLSIFQGAFDDLDAEPHFPEAHTLTPERRYYIVRHASMAQKWLAGLHQASLEAALMGNPDPGSKAVIGQRGNRYFVDEVAAQEVLTGAVGEAAFKPRQLIGITEAEKLLKPGKKKQGHPEAWEALQKLVDQPDGKPILVPADDARPALTPIADMFDDLD
ncbi:DUF2800 domain-containing protein [Plastorhodobacter daqingensis]|uniref:DUF2800 domain-containing protein n=1 Tax=Plastorhodobacter daqingensis TaxID=1387281 RepID=A0ABW2UNG3_9RHOB